MSIESLRAALSAVSIVTVKSSVLVEPSHAWRMLKVDSKDAVEIKFRQMIYRLARALTYFGSAPDRLLSRLVTE